MAFEPSLEKIYQKYLDQFVKDIELAALKMAQGAAVSITRSLSKVINSKEFSNLVNKAFSSHQAKAAAEKFAKTFMQTATKTVRSMKTVAGIIADIEKRTDRLAMRMTRGFSEATKTAFQMKRVIKDIDDQLAKNTQLTRRLNQELKNALAANNLNPGAAGPLLPNSPDIQGLQDQLNAIKKMNADLKATRKSAQVLPDAMRQLEIKEKTADIIGKYLGPIEKFFSGIRIFAGVVKSLFSSPLGILLGSLIIVLEAFKFIFGQMRESLKVFREHGYTGSQSLFLTGRANEAQYATLKRGVVSSLEEASQYTAAMAEELGSLRLPQQFINDALLFGKVFNISDRQMATVIAMQYRLGGRNVEQTLRAVTNVANVALKNGISTEQVFGMIAEHGEDLAKSGIVSMEALAQAAIDSKRIGINLSSLTHVADMLVSDFEGALRAQATLQTFFPQANLTPLMFASQFGTIDQVKNELKTTMKGMGMDFNTMPRSFKLLLSRSLGLSVQEIGNLMNNKDELDPMQMQLDKTEIIKTTLVDAFSGRSGSVQEILRNILAAVSPIKSVADFFSGMTSKVGSSFKTASLLSASLVTGVPLIGMPARPRELADTLDAMRMDSLAVANMRQHGVGGESTNATSQELLKKIAENTEKSQKVVINIDGRKVGEALVKSNGRQ